MAFGSNLPLRHSSQRICWSWEKAACSMSMLARLVVASMSRFSRALVKRAAASSAASASASSSSLSAAGGEVSFWSVSRAGVRVVVVFLLVVSMTVLGARVLRPSFLRFLPPPRCVLVVERAPSTLGE